MRSKEIGFGFGTVDIMTWISSLLSLLKISFTNDATSHQLEIYRDSLRHRFGKRYHVFTYFRGRVGLTAILTALGVGPGDEVIIPAFTCVPVPNSVAFTGARAVFADVEPCHFNASADTLLKHVSTKTKALIVQHTFGYPVHGLDEIVRFCHSKKILLIEDCCHALGVNYRGKPLGTFGDAAFFSTERSKMITTVYGGFAVTKNEILAKHMSDQYHRFITPPKSATKSLLSEFALFWLAYALGFGRHIGAMSYYLTKYGVYKPINDAIALDVIKSDDYEMQFSNAQATIGLRQLAKLDESCAHRQLVSSFYYEHLSLAGIKCFENVHHYPVIRYPFVVTNKDKLIRLCADKNLYLGHWFESSIHPRCTKVERLGYITGQCPEAEYMADHIVNLPTHPKINLHDAKNAVNILWHSIDQ